MKKTKFLALLMAGTMLTGTMVACSEDEPDEPLSEELTITKVEPTADLKEGDVVTITGTNLNKAIAVVFAASESDYKTVMQASYEAGATATEVKVKVPAGTGFPCYLAMALSLTEQVVYPTPLTAAAPTGIVITTNDSRSENGEGNKEASWTVLFGGYNFDQITSLTLDGVEQTKLESSAWHTDGWEGLDQYGYLVRSATELAVRVPENAPLGKDIVMVILPGNVTDTLKLKPAVNVDPNAPLVLWDFETTKAPTDPKYTGSLLGVIGVAAEWGGTGLLDSVNDAEHHFFIGWKTWSAAYWMVADNWMFPFPTVTTSERVLKIDIRLTDDIVSPPSDDTTYAVINVIIKTKDGGDYTYNILPKIEEAGIWTTNGAWKTISIDLATEWTALPAELSNDIVGDRGIGFAQNNMAIDFTGLGIDNVRFEKK